MKWIKHCQDIQIKKPDGSDGDLVTHGELLLACLEAPQWKSSLKLRRRADALADKIEASKPGRWIGIDDEDAERLLEGLEVLLQQATNTPRALVRQQDAFFAAIENPAKGDGPPAPHED